MKHLFRIIPACTHKTRGPLNFCSTRFFTLIADRGVKRPIYRPYSYIKRISTKVMTSLNSQDDSKVFAAICLVGWLLNGQSIHQQQLRSFEPHSIGVDV